MPYQSIYSQQPTNFNYDPSLNNVQYPTSGPVNPKPYQTLGPNVYGDTTSPIPSNTTYDNTSRYRPSANQGIEQSGTPESEGFTLSDYGQGVGIAKDLTGIYTGIQGLNLSKNIADRQLSSANANLHNQAIIARESLGRDAYNRTIRNGGTIEQAEAASNSAQQNADFKSNI